MYCWHVTSIHRYWNGSKWEMVESIEGTILADDSMSAHVIVVNKWGCKDYILRRHG